ncbi:MAG: site-2 protease family protein [Gemmataceae bacterium]
MRDPFSWSFPIGRFFGILVKVHLLFPLVALGLILRSTTLPEAGQGMWLQCTILMGLLFSSILLHEFGHCYAARSVDGDANEVLLWPLGGLAAVDVPQTPRANFITAAGGPMVNVFLCVTSALFLLFAFDKHYWAPINPFVLPMFVNLPAQTDLYAWGGTLERVSNISAVTLARLFWLNWVLLLLNLLPGYPLDGGRMLQAAVWARTSYRQGTETAVYAGFAVMLLIGVYSIVMWEPLAIFLAWFIYQNCRNQWIMLETGGEESVFGYDFTQGYTSLEREQQAPPRRKRQSFWQRWLQRRAQKRLQREQEQREAEERRLDELLDKVKRLGRDSLTAEENRFLERVSARYRNRD